MGLQTTALFQCMTACYSNCLYSAELYTEFSLHSAASCKFEDCTCTLMHAGCTSDIAIILFSFDIAYKSCCLHTHTHTHAQIHHAISRSIIKKWNKSWWYERMEIIYAVLNAYDTGKRYRSLNKLTKAGKTCKKHIKRTTMQKQVTRQQPGCACVHW